MAEQILALHSDKPRVNPGELVEAKIDVAMSHEMFGSRVLPLLEKAGVTKIWDPTRLVLILDHWAPAPSEEAAIIHQRIREFVQTNDLPNFYDVGSGICHQILAEKGFLRPGELVVGTDSHMTTGGAFGVFATGIGATDMTIVLSTGQLWFRVPESLRVALTGKVSPNVMSKDAILYLIAQLGPGGASYKSIEFCGDGIDGLSIDSRMTMTNMTIEAGAKAALIPPDDIVIQFVKTRTKNAFKPVYPEKNATYSDELEIDVSKLEPQIALPPLPTQVKPVREVAGKVIDQAFLGSCTNGRMEDLRIAAQLLKQKGIAPNVRFIVIPASREIYQSAIQEGLIEIFLKAGATIGSPSCGPCFGGHCGILAPGEVCISTTNRNFQGRMGSPQAEIYLASPATVAASALTGYITDPRDGGEK